MGVECWQIVHSSETTFLKGQHCHNMKVVTTYWPIQERVPVLPICINRCWNIYIILYLEASSTFFCIYYYFTLSDNIISVISWQSEEVFELTKLVVIGTDCIRSCKYNCHTITTTIFFLSYNIFYCICDRKWWWNQQYCIHCILCN